MATRYNGGSWRWAKLPGLGLALLALTTLALPARAATGDTTRVSVGPAGVEGDNESKWPAISGDGRYIAFRSYAANLVNGDTNNVVDIFVHDRVSGSTERVNVSTMGAQANSFSQHPTISSDGRYVAFPSAATNLIDGQTTTLEQIYVRDRTASQTRVISLGADDKVADGLGATRSAISGDGRYVAFVSKSTNMPGGSNSKSQVYRRDLQQNVTELVSVSTISGLADDNVQDGSCLEDVRPPAISASGRYIAFSTKATNLIAGDSNGLCDVFLRDMQTGTTTRVSVRTDGTAASTALKGSRMPAISDDGRYVAFISNATELKSGGGIGWQVLVRDTQTDTTTQVSIGHDNSAPSMGDSIGGDIALSANGRYIAFSSSATNLVSGGTPFQATNAFVRDMQGGVTSVVSRATGGDPASSGTVYGVAISDGGGWVAFGSSATSLVANDTNSCTLGPGTCPDVFLHERASESSGVTVSGSVTLQGRGASSAAGPGMAAGHAAASVRLDDGTPVSVAADGTFTLPNVAAGAHTLHAAAPGFLGALGTIQVSGSPFTATSVTLPAGRVTNDETVNISDVTTLIAAFGRGTSDRTDGNGNVVDLNGDGVVNLRDLSLLLSNFGRTGPITW